MFMPSMLNMADVMADSGYTEEAVFDCGISGQIVFLVVVPMLGSCRVPIEALAHFVAGADDYTAEGMPEHWSGSLSGKWTIKRDRLRILGSSWNIFSDDCAKLAEAWAAATPAPSIDDGFKVPLAEQYKLNARLSIATGRCTLHEAAEIFSIEAGEHNEVILSKLEAAARSGLLPVFDPGRNMRREYGDSTRVRVFDVEVFCDDLNKWLDANEPRVSYRFPVSLVVAPSTAPAQHTGLPVAAGALDALPDHERRLARLRELGGSAKYSRGAWTFSAISKLVKSEKAEGRKRSDEKTIRADLREAADNEREAKRTGVFEHGLGSR